MNAALWFFIALEIAAAIPALIEVRRRSKREAGRQFAASQFTPDELWHPLGTQIKVGG